MKKGKLITEAERYLEESLVEESKTIEVDGKTWTFFEISGRKVFASDIKYRNFKTKDTFNLGMELLNKLDEYYENGYFDDTDKEKWMKYPIDFISDDDGYIAVSFRPEAGEKFPLKVLKFAYEVILENKK